MDIGSLLLVLALVLLVAAFVARPVIEQAAQRDANGVSSPADDLIAQREAVLIELRDLDFDHVTGKISDEDYDAQRARLVAQGADIFRALDQVPAAGLPKPSDDLDAEIERLVAARRRPARKLAASRGAALSASTRPAGGYCPRCGKPCAAGDKFCAHCGAKLSVAEAAR